jgi:hypothetical protein
MNCLLIKALLATGQLKSGQEYDFDFDHQFIETENKSTIFRKRHHKSCTPAGAKLTNEYTHRTNKNVLFQERTLSSIKQK